MLRDLVALSGGELVAKAMGFVAFAYLARVLNPEAYGVVELAVALALFFALIVNFGLGPIGARELARDRARTKPLAAQIPAARLILALLAIPLMVGSALAMGQPRQTVELVCLFSIGLLAAPWLQQWLFQGLELMGWISAAQPIRMVVFLFGVVILVHGPQDLNVVGYVEIASAGAIALYYLAVQQWRITPIRLTFRWRQLRELMEEGFSLGLGQIVWALNQYLSTLLVAVFLANSEIAYFGAAGRIVLSLASFMHLYHFNLFPAVSKSLHVSNEAFLKLTRPSLRVTAWLGVALALPVSLIATPLCVLIFGDAFDAAGAPLAIIVWTLPTILLSGHARFALIAAGQQRYVLVSQLSGVVSTLALGALLIPNFGLVGAAATMLASFQVVWITAYVFTRRHVAHIPFLTYLWRPAIAALGAVAVTMGLSLTGWLAGLAATALFTTTALVLDRQLFSAARDLARARDATPSDEGGATEFAEEPTSGL